MYHFSFLFSLLSILLVMYILFFVLVFILSLVFNVYTIVSCFHIVFGACAFYTTQIWVYEIQECLFLYSVYWFMAFTIKMPLTVSICLYFYHPYEFNLGLGPSHCFGGLARPLRLGPILDLSQARHNNAYLKCRWIRQWLNVAQIDDINLLDPQ